MKTYRIIKILLLFLIILFFPSCFTSSGSLLSDVVNADSGDSSDSEDDDPYEEDEEEEGRLSIHSSPSGCDIYINNRYYGTSPLYLEDMPGGYYTVRAEKEGYLDDETSFYYDEGSNYSVSLYPQKVFGYIDLEITPYNAVVTFNGYTLEQGINKVPVGEAYLRASLFGYTPFSEYLVIFEQQTVPVAITLDEADFGILGFRTNRPRFNPESYSTLGKVKIIIEAAAPGAGRVSVKNQQGLTVREFDDIVFNSITTNITWDGKDDNGIIVPDGIYTIMIDAADHQGNFRQTRTISVEADSSFTFDLFNSWNGVSGLLYSPNASTLPDNSFSVSLLSSLSIDQRGGGDPIFRLPVQISSRISLVDRFELGLQATLILSNGGGPVNIGVSLKYALLPDGFFRMAAYGKMTYVNGTLADTQANYTGLAAGTAMEAVMGPVHFVFSPEAVISYTYPDLNGPVPFGVYAYGYLKGGIALDLDMLSAGISGSFRLRPFSEGLAFDFPAQAAFEINITFPDFPVKASLIGGLEFTPVSYYNFWGIGLGFTE